jgi:hypothetical protein
MGDRAKRRATYDDVLNAPFEAFDLELAVLWQDVRL